MYVYVRPVHFINLVPRIVYIGGSNCMVTQGGSGHWAVYSTSPQSFIITFFNSLANNFGDYKFIVICLFI